MTYGEMPPQPPETPGDARARARAERAYRKAQRPWVLRHKFLTGLAALIILVIIIVVATGGGGNNNGAGIPGAASDHPAKGKVSNYTQSQQQAIGSAQDYLKTQAFSKKGLIDQLDSQAGSGFKKKDAVFAVNHINVNWDQEAVQAAKEYLQNEHFSRSGLIQQLDSSAGAQFTKAQAIYAANHVGL